MRLMSRFYGDITYNKERFIGFLTGNTFKNIDDARRYLIEACGRQWAGLGQHLYSESIKIILEIRKYLMIDWYMVQMYSGFLKEQLYQVHPEFCRNDDQARKMNDEWQVRNHLHKSLVVMINGVVPMFVTKERQTRIGMYNYMLYVDLHGFQGAFYLYDPNRQLFDDNSTDFKDLDAKFINPIWIKSFKCRNIPQLYVCAVFDIRTRKQNMEFVHLTNGYLGGLNCIHAAIDTISIAEFNQLNADDDLKVEYAKKIHTHQQNSVISTESMNQSKVVIELKEQWKAFRSYIGGIADIGMNALIMDIDAVTKNIHSSPIYSTIYKAVFDVNSKDFINNLNDYLGLIRKNYNYEETAMDKEIDELIRKVCEIMVTAIREYRIDTNKVLESYWVDYIVVMIKRSWFPLDNIQQIFSFLSEYFLSDFSSIHNVIEGIELIEAYFPNIERRCTAYRNLKIAIGPISTNKFNDYKRLMDFLCDCFINGFPDNSGTVFGRDKRYVKNPHIKRTQINQKLLDDDKLESEK